MNRKIKLIITITVVLSLAFCALVGCKKDPTVDDSNMTVEQYVSNVYNSLDKVTKVVAKMSMTKGEVEISSYTRTIQIDGNNANVTTEEKAFDSQTIGYTTTTKSEVVQNVSKQSLLPVTLETKYLGEGVIVDGKLTCQVDSAKAQAMLGGVSVEGNMKIACQLEGKNITSIQCLYKTTQGNDVVLTFTYSY